MATDTGTWTRRKREEERGIGNLEREEEKRVNKERRDVKWMEG